MNTSGNIRMLFGRNALFFLCLLLALPAVGEQKVIPLDAFQDGALHWQKKYGRDRNDGQLEALQIREIADNILRYQNKDGGWPKDLDYQSLTPETEVRALRGDSLKRSTFDNHSTFPQIEYLAKTNAYTQDERYLNAAVRGLEYLLGEQRPSGGWRGADVDAITYNDGVMTGIMDLLLDIREDAPHFAPLEEALRERCIAALDRAIAVTLAAQIRQDGVRTGWGQQHDHLTLVPVKARSYELPGIATNETVFVLRFLMRIPNPSLEIIAAVDAAVVWLEGAKLEGIRLEEVPMTPVRFENHTASADRRVVADPAAPPLWARYYELETNRPFFCRRDGTVVYTLEEVDLERRTGYGWYGQGPRSLLSNHYPAWRKALAAQ